LTAALESNSRVTQNVKNIKCQIKENTSINFINMVIFIKYYHILILINTLIINTLKINTEKSVKMTLSVHLVGEQKVSF